jgi:integrase/recombinase XerD
MLYRHMKKPVYKPVFNRKDSLNSDGAALVQIQVYLRRKHRYVSTGLYLRPEHWDKVKWCVNRKDAEYLNQKIRMQIHDLEEYEYKARSNGEVFELDMISQKKTPGKNFLGYMETSIDQDPISPGTKKQHKATLAHIKAFGKIVYFSDLTRKNIETFDRYLHELKLTQSSVHGQHKRLKKWVRKAIIDGHIKEDPYLAMKISPGNRNTIKYLSEEELAAMEKKRIRNKRLAVIRDIFLFSCYTGLAYQEAANLTYDNIAMDPDGVTWLTGERKKVSGNRTNSATGEFMVPLHEKAVAIMKRYKNKRMGFVLPILSNQQYNSFLKEIAILCDIDINLTTHVARHTFATTFTMAKGISIESVKEMLGHSSIRMTERYAKVLKSRVREEMKKIL